MITGNFTCGVWLEGSKTNEGQERHPEKGRILTGGFFFPLGQETEILQSWLYKEKSHIHHKKSLHSAWKKNKLRSRFLECSKNKYQELPVSPVFRNYQFSCATEICVKGILPSVPIYFKIYSLFPPLIFLMSTSSSPPSTDACQPL